MSRIAHTATYYSLEEFVAAAQRGYSLATADGTLTSGTDEWAGASFAEACELAAHGWADGLAAASDIAEHALTLIQQEAPASTFNAQHDVTGGECDVARFLAGVPENMLEYEPITISRVGRTVTLCVSGAFSAAVKPESVMRRGAAIVALCTALEATQHAVELWADIAFAGQVTARTRVMVKGTSDVVDAERIAYAFAHPSMTRRLSFAERWTHPSAIQRGTGVGRGYGKPTNPARDMPEGTIYLDALYSAVDVPNPQTYVIETLRGLGLIAGED